MNLCADAARCPARVSTKPIRLHPPASKDLLKKLRRCTRSALPDTCVILERLARGHTENVLGRPVDCHSKWPRRDHKKASGRYSSRDLFAT